MEYETSDWVQEQSQMGATINTEEEAAAISTAYIDIEIDLNYLKHEPELVQSVKSVPAMWMKKEIVEDSNEDDSQQQCTEVSSTPAGAGSLYEANSTSQGDSINVKQELEEMEIGPTVLQHMDIHYALNKSTVDGCNIAMRCSEEKKYVEHVLKDSLTPQEAMKKEWIPVLQSYQHGVQEHHLAACSVHITRLDVFQCDLCHTVFVEKRQLIQHLQAVHAYCPQTPFNVKFRKTNEQTAEDYKATSYNCSQISMEVDYEERRMKSHLEQQKYLQKHLHQQRTTSSNGFKCNRTPQLLVERNKLHQRKNSKAVMTTGTVAGPSNQNRDKSTKTKQKPFEWKVCEKAYPSKVDLNLHKRSHSKVELKNNFDNYVSHTRKKPYHHDEKFSKSGDLIKNMGVHSGEKSFQCKLCEARFARKSALTMHLRVHTGEKHYQCETCDSKFALKSDLTMHLRVHTGEKRYQCDMCHAKFAIRWSLIRHMRAHTGKKPFQCKICDTRFARRSALTMHVRVHTGEKPYQCEMCDSKFALKGNLTKHMRVHTGKKPFQCKICDARFAHKSSLTIHMRLHTGEKPYQCKICDARFAQKIVLTIHIRIHTGEKPFQCNICEARFAQKIVLTIHMRVHTGEKPYKCEMCDSKFAQKSSLTRHIRASHG